MITIKKIREDKKFSIRGKKENEYVDVYQGIDVSPFDLDWLYGYFPDERSQTKFIQKFVMRDLFRLTEFGESIPYVNRGNLFWYEIISSPALKNWGRLVSYLPPYERREFIRSLGISITKDISELKRRYSEDPNKNQDGDPEDTEKVNRIIINSILSKISDNIEKVKKELNEQSKSEAGKEKRTQDLELAKETIKNSKVSERILSLIKETKSRLSGTLINEFSLFTRESIPSDIRDMDAFADETVFLMKIANGDFHKREKFGKLKIDIYVDRSGSMDEYLSIREKKTNVAYGFLSDLLKNFYKYIENIYVFDTELKLFSNRFIKFPCGDGGTDISVVYDNIIKRRGTTSIVISDLEDRIRIKSIKPLENAYYIQVGSKMSEWASVFKKAYQIE